MTPQPYSQRWHRTRFTERALAVSARQVKALSEAGRARVLASLLAEAARLRSANRLPEWLWRSPARAGWK